MWFGLLSLSLTMWVNTQERNHHTKASQLCTTFSLPVSSSLSFSFANSKNVRLLWQELSAVLARLRGYINNQMLKTKYTKASPKTSLRLRTLAFTYFSLLLFISLSCVYVMWCCTSDLFFILLWCRILCFPYYTFFSSRTSFLSTFSLYTFLHLSPIFLALPQKKKLLKTYQLCVFLCLFCSFCYYVCKILFEDAIMMMMMTIVTECKRQFYFTNVLFFRLEYHHNA